MILSGAGTLVLEVCWFRRTAQVAGATSVAMGAVLAAVIGGMAAGSFLFGRVADRSRAPLRLYGLLEAGIVAGALLTPLLLDVSQVLFDLLQRHLGDTPSLLTVTRFLLATLLLAPPAILMGGSLPAAACAVACTKEDRGRALGWLYAANTLGAVAGTFAAGFLLIPALGLSGAMRSAALLSGAAAAAALLIRARAPDPAAAAEAVAPQDASRAIRLYAVSGFLGLAAEVAFTRSLVLVFGSTTYAFTTMLGVFLLGIGLGGALGARLARRTKNHVRLLENTVALTAVLFSLAALLVYVLPRLFLQGYVLWGSTFGVGLGLRLALSMLVLLPGALGLGVAFPLAAHVASAGAMGAGTGRLYAANTLASILGSTCAVFLLVPHLGPQHTVAILAVGAALYVVAGARRLGPALLLLAACAGLLPPSPVARERLLAGVYFYPGAWLYGEEVDEVAWEAGVDIPFYAYGHEATVSVWRWYGTNSLLIDGKAVATNQVLADDHHLSLLGHVPMAIHEDPRRVLVVGLGMGTTYRAVRMHGPETLRVVELEGAVAEAAATMGVEPEDLVIADARSYLRATKERFDVITSDPIHPWVRGGGDLYTKEYFESCRARLAEGGVACQWLPVYQMGVGDIRDIVRTFSSVFRTAAYFGGGDLVLVGVVDGDPAAPRALDGAARDALARLGAADLSLLKVAGHERLQKLAGRAAVLTDDALRLEFSTPRYLDNHALGDCFAWLGELWPEPPAPYAAVLAAEEARARGDWPEVTSKLTLARKQAPRNAFVQRLWGELSMSAAESGIRSGQLVVAGVDLEAAKRDLPGDPRLIGIEADLREAEGNKAEAARLFRKLLAKSPNSRYLERRLAKLE